ncbi:putative mannan endo-1,4-beta-mannosidase 9 [Diospyros lotus]|uniref:putative mannan endo-1,4-beta-mannosidase 9 n=1 Tax=Diospyros lotus TaxID=55363 RepID=UPI00225A2E9F|nr:putative mannan endo-1,4-beta-mannosidase 9 [Diospyros lotus]
MSTGKTATPEICNSAAANRGGFVKTSGAHFVLNGRKFYFNGFNAYWMMSMASDAGNKDKVTTAFQQASNLGLNAVRTWAFSDGSRYKALQPSPGYYDEEVFRALDFVVSEAGKHGIYLILSLVNNWDDYGGKKQYVQWAKDKGHYLNNDDDFFSDPLVKGFYKDHIKAVLTRVNSITGVAYKNDPTIFAWELMNEPRCQSDLSGRPFQYWVEEMAGYVKSIDENHLVEIGQEGFYGESAPERKEFNPGYEVGTDFIANNRVPAVDFGTIHLYPEQWVYGSSEEAQDKFAERWIESHIQDSDSAIRKPLLVTEFGKSSRVTPYYNDSKRDAYFQIIFDTVYGSARSGGSCGGELFWQLMVSGMDGWHDGYEVVLEDSPSTASLISQESQKLSGLDW